MAGETDTSVVAAVLRDLEGLPENLARSALAMSALALARELDDPGNSATSKSMCAKALADACEKLRAMKPPERKADKVDELTERRRARRTRRPAPAS